MIRVTAERSKESRVVVKEHLGRPALHEWRKTCARHVAESLRTGLLLKLYANALDRSECGQPRDSKDARIFISVANQRARPATVDCEK
jgi:hypothetical protein